MKTNDGFDGLGVKWWSIDDYPGNARVSYETQKGVGIGRDKRS